MPSWDKQVKPEGVVRFGAFEVDLRAGELRKQGVKIKLQEQPFQILVMLLDHAGEAVTREEVRRKLWSGDTFVDFDHSLATAVKKLRQALNDDAEAPRYVETLPRRGYRFIAPVESDKGAARTVGAPSPQQNGRPSEAQSLQAAPARRRSWMVAAVVAFAVVGTTSLELWNHFRTTPPFPSIRSIVVLPLENLSRDPLQEYLVDGITEELTTDLGRISALQVISRTSAMYYKGTHKTLPEIAQELKVDAVVEGAVLRSGNRIRITAQLVQAATDRHLWAETYERELRDVLTLQDEVARAIATEVKIKLLPQEQTRLASARPVNPEAYEAYLRGRYEWNKWTRENVEKSIEYFQQALQKDPVYAQAWAGLSDAYDLAASLGPQPMALPKAKAAALKALELDDTLSEAHVSLGDVMRDLEWSWSAAEKEYRRAITLDPNNALARAAYGRYLMAVGRLDEAIGAMNRARELDPLDANRHYTSARASYAAGRYDEALQQYREMDALGGVRSPPTDRRIALAYERKGMQREALTELLATMGLRGENELAALVEKKYRSSGYSEAKKTFLRGEILEAEKMTDRFP